MATVAAPGEPALDLEDVNAALAKTTELLARELGNPGTVPPKWSDMEWQVAKAVSAIHGVSALLGGRLRWQGPPGWNSFLIEQRSHIAARMADIQAMLGRMDACARQRGLPIVTLKGAALHARGLYAAGERPMADIDILVREQDAGHVAALLAELGYRPGAVTWKHRAFEPSEVHASVSTLGEDAAAPVKIEMHTSIREPLPVRIVDISHMVFPEQPQPGLNGYECTAALLSHVLLHASGAMVLRELRLLHLNDIARLCAVVSGQDWDAFFRLSKTTQNPTLWWAYPPLLLAQRYYGCVPEHVLDRAARACSWLLRRGYRQRTLTDVSISHLWISAFPGIEWARSPREMARYVRRRLLPSAETLALRAEFAAAQPEVSGGQWSRTSQLQRMLRWSVAKQARQATLQTVRASMKLPP
jgi:hypothetical protein